MGSWFSNMAAAITPVQLVYGAGGDAERVFCRMLQAVIVEVIVIGEL